MCVMTGTSKSPLRNLIIFSPLEGGTTFDEGERAGCAAKGYPHENAVLRAPFAAAAAVVVAVAVAAVGTAAVSGVAASAAACSLCAAVVAVAALDALFIAWSHFGVFFLGGGCRNCRLNVSVEHSTHVKAPGRKGVAAAGCT